MRLVVSVKGGKGSGNFGHAGRPGKVGGSVASSEMTVAIANILRDRHGGTEVREGLIKAFESEFPQALDAFHTGDEDVMGVYLFGSFASDKAAPGDIDLIVRLPDDHPLYVFDPKMGRVRQADGSMDGSVWMQTEHKCPIFFVRNELMLKMLIKEFNKGMKDRGYNAEVERLY